MVIEFKDKVVINIFWFISYWVWSYFEVNFLFWVLCCVGVGMLLFVVYWYVRWVLVLEDNRDIIFYLFIYIYLILIKL